MTLFLFVIENHLSFTEKTAEKNYNGFITVSSLGVIVSMEVQIRTGFFSTESYDMLITSTAIAFTGRDQVSGGDYLLEAERLEKIVLRKIKHVNASFDIVSSEQSVFGFMSLDDPKLPLVLQDLCRYYGRLIEPALASWRELYQYLIGVAP